MQTRSLGLPGAIALGGLVVLGFSGCHGGGTAPAPVIEQPGFTLSLSPSAMTLSPGGSGTVTVSVGRFGGFTGAVNLALENAPAGITTSGTIAAGTTSGKLTIWAQSGLPAQAFPALAVTGRADGLSRSQPFALTLLSVVSELPVDRVQAAGTLQRSANGAIHNQPLAGEPVRATAAQSNPIENRSGFVPNGQ